MGDIFIPRTNGSRLTEVSLISTKYGTDRNIKVLGYIAEEPYVVLVELIASYFVSGYNEELYPLCNTSLKHTLFIKDYGNRYEPMNFARPQFHDIDSFIVLTGSDLRLTRIIDPKEEDMYENSEKHMMHRKEYLNTLNIIRKTNPIIQKAINQVELLDIYKIYDNDRDDDTKLSLLKSRINKLSSYVTDDYETMALLSHIMKMIIRIAY